MRITPFACALAALFMSVTQIAAAQPMRPAAPSSGPLDETQLRSLLVGHTLSSVNLDRQPYSETFQADGTILGRSVRKEDLSTPIWDYGKWRMQGNAMCITWNN